MNAFDKYFGDTYELVDLLKSDEKNFVALVYDKNSKRLCAMKKRNPKSAELYRILKDLRDPHIPEIYRLFERNENLIVIEEHIDGQTLEELLTYQMKDFDEKFVEDIFLQICDCLEKIHEKNIIHRDLTLSNIMLTKNNFVKLIDFGIARIFKPDGTADTEFLGTRGYAAPEQYGLFDLGQTDPRTDIFNLGVAMKKILGENYRGRLKKILNRCTNLNPDSRYKNISELIKDLKRTRKIYLLKRVAFIFSSTFTIFLATQLINTANKNEPPSPEIDSIDLNENLSEEKIDAPETETPASNSNLNSELTEKLIDFAKNPPINVSPSVPEVPALPPTPSPPEVRQKSDRVKLFLYINGKLTENRGEHTTDGDFYITENVRNWQVFVKGQYYKWFLYPAHWTARLKIENFTDKDLISPKITVSFSGEKIVIDHPTIKAGQVAFVDLPIAGKRALSILSENHFSGGISVRVDYPNGKQIASLHRDLEVE